MTVLPKGHKKQKGHSVCGLGVWIGHISRRYCQESLRRNSPARNPREGVLQYLKPSKERKSQYTILAEHGCNA